MKFGLKIKFENDESDDWTYDTLDNEIVSARFGVLNPRIDRRLSALPQYDLGSPVLKDLTKIQYMEINLGFHCNLDCEYCPQIHLRNDFHSSSPKEVGPFIERLKNAKERGLNPRAIRFWGGEPLVYWKTLKPLIEEVAKLYPGVIFHTCTNGYLLTKDKLDYLHKYGFGISVSHDGFEYQDGEAYRRSLMAVEGMPEILDYAIELFGNKFCFSSTINPETPNSEKKIQFFHKKFGDRPFRIITLPFKYNGNNVNHRDEFKFTDDVKSEFRRGMRDLAVSNFEMINEMPFSQRKFVDRIVNREHIDSARYYCNMPYDGIVVDLAGNVFNCHCRYEKTGTLEDINATPARNMVTWKHREICRSCPFVQLCGGGCCTQTTEQHKDSCDDCLYDCNYGLFVGVFKRLFNVEVVEIRPL